MVAELTAAGFDVVAAVADGDGAAQSVSETRRMWQSSTSAPSAWTPRRRARRLRAGDGHPLSIIAMADRREADRVAELVAAGATGYVVKDDVRELIAAVRAVASGAGFLSTAVTKPVLDQVAQAV